LSSQFDGTLKNFKKAKNSKIMRFVKFNPFAPAALQTVNHLFDEVRNWSDFVGGADFAHTHPAVNITENEQAFKIELAAPGLAKEAFKIHLEKGQLTISATQKAVAETQNPTEMRYTRREFNYATFKRSFELPENVDVTQIKAAYEQGVLTLTIPKAEPKNLTQSIEIQ
jgi:HSP20 family protein